MILSAATLSIVLAMLLPSSFAPPGNADDGDRREALQELLEAAYPRGADEAPDPGSEGSRQAFLEVLSSKLFLHKAVGPFDVYVMKADGFASGTEASKVLGSAVRGLEPVVPVMQTYFGGEAGLAAGRRFPIVLASADRSKGQHSFDNLVALLDWAEDDYTDWKPSGNPVWDVELRAAETVRTWEVQLFNVAQVKLSAHGAAFYEHGLGYYTLAHVAARVLRQGAWGLVPPWLAQGLIDELDIAAYGEAWVGGDTWTRQVAGWYRPGWSGFVPQGSSPPPPVTGPPADLAVTITETGDSWQQRSSSGHRHWPQLAADRESEAPASFRFMAENESFLPRDRAYARFLLHILLDVGRGGRMPLTESLDRIPATPPSGMPDADPITVVMSRALGGVPAVEQLESMPAREMLETIGRPEIGKQMKSLGGEGLLALSDHREQAQWLYRQPIEDLDWDVRNELWRLILEAEYYQQLYEWKSIGEALDAAATAALAVSPSYPMRADVRATVATAFWGALPGSKPGK